jgi:hypothetical protein
MKDCSAVVKLDKYHVSNADVDVIMMMIVMSQFQSEKAKYAVYTFWQDKNDMSKPSHVTKEVERFPKHHHGHIQIFHQSHFLLHWFHLVNTVCDLRMVRRINKFGQQVDVITRSILRKQKRSLHPSLSSSSPFLASMRYYYSVSCCGCC